MTQSPPVDLFVVGGGVNGCGIARDAAGRGYSVFLAEKNDFASGTSSRSTKLIHGGLRYLEYYEFKLVREALAEREILWAMAPHIISPMRFVLPHKKGLRPAWLIRLGLFLYDNIGGRRRLPPTSMVNLETDVEGAPLRVRDGRAFEYSDCFVDDARLVALNGVDAAARGAVVHLGCELVQARREDGLWHLEVVYDDGTRKSIQARVLINAAGPWVDKVLSGALGEHDPRNVRLVRGSHIVVRRRFPHDKAYFFQNPDGRILFAVPYQQEFTLIGTTDRDQTTPPEEVAIGDDEVDYLIEAINGYLAESLAKSDVVWGYAGVRALYDDGASKAQDATRDYVLKKQGKAGQAPLISVIGGKITTFRHLAEAALKHVEKHLGARGGPWTAQSHLPGGDFGIDDYAERLAALQAAHPYLPEAMANRLFRLYGTYADKLLGDAKSLEDLGAHIGADLYGAEVDYLLAHEFARTAEDILWRRTKMGLWLSELEQALLVTYLADTKGQTGAGDQ